MGSLCPHCTSFKPEWQKLGRQIELDNGHSCEVHSENCVENRHAPQKWGIQVDGFPHMSLFKDGKEIDSYEGPRNSSSIKNGLSLNVTNIELFF